MNAIQAPLEASVGKRRGSRRGHSSNAAVARAVARCRPLVIRSSQADDVIAAAIDACATGKTVYTSTDGAGLLHMAPALFRASHIGLPIVMTVRSARGHRDHGHAMALRDCGWVQLYPSDDQDAVDTHIQAFRIAEWLSLPVMVCLDAFEAASSPDQPQVPSSSAIEAFLERGDSQPPARPVQEGERLDAHTEMRYVTHVKQSIALTTIQQVAADYRRHFGRRSGGTLTTHKLDGARLAVFGLGSTFEAIIAAVDELREHGVSAGAIGLRSFRPFPTQDVASVLLHCQRVVVVERAVAAGIGGIVTTDVRSALARLPVQTYTVIAGLGERPISRRALSRVLYRAARGNLEELCFLDLNRDFLRGRGSVAMADQSDLPT